MRVKSAHMPERHRGVMVVRECVPLVTACARGNDRLQEEALAGANVGICLHGPACMYVSMQVV
jgi:hypothetical protein